MNHQRVFRMFIIDNNGGEQRITEAKKTAVQGVQVARASAPRELTAAKAHGVEVDAMQERLQDLTAKELSGSSAVKGSPSIPPAIDDMLKMNIQTRKESERNFSQPMHSDPLTKDDDKIDLEGEANPFLRREVEVEQRRKAAKDQADAEGLRDFQRQLQRQPADSQRALRDPALTRTQPGFSNLQRALARQE
jgi:hypothetical protein